jgi:uncharacterized protein
VTRKSAILIPVIIAAAAVGGLGIAFLPAEVREPDRTDFSKGTVRLDEKVITVEIADSAAERQRWLTFRQDRLPEDTVLLLRYDEPDLHEVWMLNIEHELDLIWLDADGNVVYTKEKVPPCQNVVETVSCTYKTTSRSLYVIAANAGFIAANDISKETKMTIISI